MLKMDMDEMVPPYSHLEINKYETLPSTSFKTICRTCLMHHGELFTMHEVNWEGVCLEDIVNWIFLQLEKNNYLPKQMCKHCIKMMYQTYNFLKKCKNSERILKNILIRESRESEHVEETSKLNFEYNFIKVEIELKHDSTGNKIVNDDRYNTADQWVDVQIPLESDNDTDVDDHAEVENNTIEPEDTGNKLDNHDTNKTADQWDDIKIPLESDNDTEVDDPAEVECNTIEPEETGNKIDNDDSNKTDQWDDIRIPLESYNDTDIDNPAEVESNTIEPEESVADTNSQSGVLNKINTIEDRINRIIFKNEVILRQVARPQLVNYNNLPKINKITEKVNRKSIKRTEKVNRTRRSIRKGPPYTCITCNSSYQTEEELNRHKIDTKHNKSLKYQCEYCEKKYNAYCNLEEHIRTHTGEKPNKCPTCGKGFNFKADLKRHMVIHMQLKPYNCQFCNQGFSRRQYLLDHERKHTGETLLCTFCGKGFHSYQTLTCHEKLHKDRGTKSIKAKGCVRNSLTKDILYQCHLCGKATFITKQTLKAHILLHGPKNFSCEVCGKTYISKIRLQDHIQLIHQGVLFSCHLCEKEYRQKSTLADHLKSHSGENNYPCDVCGKHFAGKGSLYQHKRVHTGDTKYQCKECFHICMNKRNLEDHIRIHTGEKPFACRYCGKFFAQKSNMISHAKIHTGEKKHPCKLCDKSFYYTRGLKKHMAIHEKNGEN